MKYISTRDASIAVDAATAVTDGISADGGLFVPESFPELRYKDLLELDYPKRVDKVLRAYFDFDVKGVAAEAYRGVGDDPAPIVKLDDNLFVLELWHGATCSFEDMALAALPRLLARAKAEKHDQRTTLLLTATGGDTGKAALDAFKDADGAAVCVFYPADGVSGMQKLAMRTQDGSNVCAVGVMGNLDAVQIAVKNAFADGGLKQALAENNISLSAADCVNIGGLVPQIAYYFSAYCDLVDSDEITAGDKIDFVVPTGSFGNILAGWYALKMGLPINKLVCVSNANNTLTHFIETGTYDINREFVGTDSPSMDVLIANELERLIFEISGRNAQLTAERMAALKADGRYSLTQSEMENIRSVLAGDHADDDDIAEAIADMFDEYGYLIDPHTAAAYAVASRRGAVRPTVVVSPVHPYKFAPTVLRALGEKAKDEVTFDTFDELEELTAMDIPDGLKQVLTAEVRFNDTVAPEGVIEYIAAHYGSKAAG